MDIRLARMVTDYAGIARYALAVPGERMLAVIGVNPSTATLGGVTHHCEWAIDLSDGSSERVVMSEGMLKTDPTMRSVIACAEKFGFDGLAMFNVYALRETHPSNLPLDGAQDERIHEVNLHVIREFANRCTEATVVPAFGAAVASRGYLRQYCKDVIDALKPAAASWKQLDEPIKGGYPRHALRYGRSHDSATLNDFDPDAFERLLR